MKRKSAAQFMDVRNKIRWYVVASRAGAVVYEAVRDDGFRFVERLVNVNGKTMETDLVSDKPGRWVSGVSRGGGLVHHGLTVKLSHHEHETRLFAKRVGSKLEEERRKHSFGDLVLVAEPHFLGLLRAALAPATRRVISGEVGRDYSQGSDEKLRTNILYALEKQVA